MSERYFEKPTQVKIIFGTEDFAHDYDTGIAYKDEVICAVCGEIFNLHEEPTLQVIPYKTKWIDISESIKIAHSFDTK